MIIPPAIRLKKLQNKLYQLQAKLRAAIKLNARRMAVNAVFVLIQIEEKIKGLRSKYIWNNDFSIITNEENGQRYGVSQYGCTCPSFFHKTGLINGTCKHMRMRAELVPAEQPKLISFDKHDLPAGLWAERTDDWIIKEYQLFCYQRKLRFGEWAIDRVSVGYLIENQEGLFITARSNRGSTARRFDSTKNAALFLARFEDLKLNEIAELYAQKHVNVVSDELIWENQEEELDIHADKSDRTPKKKWFSLEDLQAV